MVPRLITIPPSHYCEKARWALERCGIEYREECHPPFLHARAVKAAGGRRSTPVLVTDDGVYPDSTDILRYLSDTIETGWQPYPHDRELRTEVEELEELFDTRLGSHTRRLAYYYLMQDTKLFVESLTAGVGRRERRLFRVMRPLIVALMRRGLRIDDTGRDLSAERVRSVFADVSDRLADGRRFLVGSVFTAADLTFASLAAPVVLPEAYGSPLPSRGELPTEFQDLVEELRANTAGAFILRCYETHR